MKMNDFWTARRLMVYGASYALTVTLARWLWQDKSLQDYILGPPTAVFFGGLMGLLFWFAICAWAKIRTARAKRALRNQVPKQ